MNNPESILNNPIVAVLFNLLMNPIVIGIIIALIVYLIKSRFGGSSSSDSDSSDDSYNASSGSSDTPATPTPTTTSQSTTSSSSYVAKSKIFINGGAPASGNIMGTITVDGKSLSLRYTDAPIEIAVTAGSRHIVVEGGLYGDARIDRIVNLGVSDVLTIDMPGEDDADVIRHQMISSVEYRKALSDAGFTVTRKYL